MPLNTFFRRFGWDSSRGIVACILIILFALVLLFLTGPLPFIAYGMQRWAAVSTWDWKDRWASIRGLAVCFGCLFLCLCGLFPLFSILLRLPLHIPWPTRSILTNGFPQLLSLSNFVPRWLLLALLAPALALFLEQIWPQTVSSLTRILLPVEAAEMQQQQEEAKANTLQPVQASIAQQAPGLFSPANGSRHLRPFLLSDPKRTNKHQTIASGQTAQDTPATPGEPTNQDHATGDQPTSSTLFDVPIPQNPQIDWSRVEE